MHAAACFTVNLGAAIATTAIWSPAVTGNIFIIGTDPVNHAKPAVTDAAIKYVIDQAGYPRHVTGLYLCLSRYYDSEPITSTSTIPVLSGFGTFRAVSPGGCIDGAHKGD